MRLLASSVSPDPMLLEEEPFSHSEQQVSVEPSSLGLGLLGARSHPVAHSNPVYPPSCLAWGEGVNCVPPDLYV